MEPISKEKLKSVIQSLMNQKGQTFTPQHMQKFETLYAQKFNK
jgi:hypothetical protein